MPLVSDAETRRVHRARVADGDEACNAALPNYSAPDRAAEYCDERVCLCVCLSVSDHIFGTTHPIFTKFLVHVIYGRGSFLLWRHIVICYVLPMDDVIFAHKPRLLDVAAQLKRREHAALGLAKLCAVTPVAD